MALWKLDKIQWHLFDPSLVDANLLRLAKGACLVEYNADDYVTYLHNVFRGDEALCADIVHWGSDERQHGEALAMWVQMADPAFNFKKSFENFRRVQPIATDAQSSIRGSKARELVARCLVETGTASYYSALADASKEPVFKQICKSIAADEIHHYKLFYRNLERYLESEGLSRWDRLKTVVERSVEAEDEELTLAFACGNYPDREIRREDAPIYARDFMSLAYRLYQKPHFAKAARLAIQAAGLPSKPWLTNSVTFVLNSTAKLRRLSYPVEGTSVPLP